ncbi:hypothetical protein, partial [Nonomuraea deserti]|uniref:hypothetical protein n=1 Tax=Nonomuraea deserti TaxID=1848322 RepID=UPI001404B132
GLAIGLHWPFCYQGWHTQLADIYAHAIEVADRTAAWEDKAQLTRTFRRRNAPPPYGARSTTT